MSIFRIFDISIYIIIILGIFKVMMLFLTGSNENPPGERLHPVADGPHSHRVVPTRLKLRRKIMMMRLMELVLMISTATCRADLFRAEESFIDGQCRAVSVERLLLIVLNLTISSCIK